MVEVQPPKQDGTQAADEQQAAAHAEHVYDGITEYDNPIPGWWTWVFVATVAYSIVYFFLVSITGDQLTPVGAYDQAVVADLKRQGGALKADAPTLVRLLKDDDSLKAGAAVFAANCVSCHNRDGSGLVGPNLTDESYLSVESITDVADVVSKGRKNGAMPAWGARLSPNEVVQVSAYVASLRGKNLPGKPAEGKAVAPWAAQ